MNLSVSVLWACVYYGMCAYLIWAQYLNQTLPYNGPLCRIWWFSLSFVPLWLTVLRITWVYLMELTIFKTALVYLSFVRFFSFLVTTFDLRTCQFTISSPKWSEKHAKHHFWRTTFDFGYSLTHTQAICCCLWFLENNNWPKMSILYTSKCMPFVYVSHATCYYFVSPNEMTWNSIDAAQMQFVLSNDSLCMIASIFGWFISITENWITTHRSIIYAFIDLKAPNNLKREIRRNQSMLAVWMSLRVV